MTTEPEVRDTLERAWGRTMSELRGRYGANRLARVEEFVRRATGELRVDPVDPLQRPVLYFFPGLTDRPWHDPGPSWIPRLEEAYPVVRRELDGLLDGRAGFVPYVRDDDDGYRAKKFNLEKLSQDWTVYDLIDPAAAVSCPETVRLLDEIFRPDLDEPATAQFSALRPGKRIPPHCGAANFFLTAHMGLVHSEDCRIRVGREDRGWTEGKAFVFDDSFEHEVWHEGRDTRIVLLVRFWHPELEEAEIESILALHEALINVVGGTEAKQAKALALLRGEAQGAARSLSPIRPAR